MLRAIFFALLTFIIIGVAIFVASLNVNVRQKFSFFFPILFGQLSRDITSHYNSTSKGVITEITSTPPSLTLGTTIPLKIVLDSNVKILNTEGEVVDFSYLKKGFEVETKNTSTSASGIVSTEIKVIKTPAIIPYTPVDKTKVGRSFEISGVARVADSVLFYYVRNLRTQRVYVNKQIYTNALTSKEWGEFQDKVRIDIKEDLVTGDPIRVEIYQRSPQDGSQLDLTTLLLSFDEKY